MAYRARWVSFPRWLVWVLECGNYVRVLLGLRSRKVVNDMNWSGLLGIVLQLLEMEGVDVEGILAKYGLALAPAALAVKSTAAPVRTEPLPRVVTPPAS